tara:strand:- start:46 stop:960 length:915 start_codon:yes stop_codon:yes gene_type:complete
MAKLLALIPSAYKLDKVASVLPMDGTGDFAFSRSTTGTRVNSSGLIEEIAIDTPRIDHTAGGCPILLIEAQATNLVNYSEDFSQATLSNCTVQSGVNAPNGNTDAYKLIEDSTSGLKLLRAVNSTSTIANTSYSASIYVKAGERTKVKVWGYQASNQYFYVQYDLTDNSYLGSLGSNSQVDGYSIQDIGTDGWKRITIKGQKNATYDWDVAVSPLDASGNDTYLGDGTSGLYIFGTQLALIDTSYIPTNGTTVTRTADIGQVTTPTGVTSITETIGGVEQAPITTIPATYTIPNGNINKVIMES